jgi:hypothetical protein
VRFVNSKPLDDLESHGIIEFAKIENGVPEQQTSALQVSDIWHKIKGHIGPNLAFLYGGHDLGRRATKKYMVVDILTTGNLDAGKRTQHPTFPSFFTRT